MNTKFGFSAAESATVKFTTINKESRNRMVNLSDQENEPQRRREQRKANTEMRQKSIFLRAHSLPCIRCVSGVHPDFVFRFPRSKRRPRQQQARDPLCRAHPQVDCVSLAERCT